MLGISCICTVQGAVILWGPRPVVLLERNLYGHPLAGLLWDKFSQLDTNHDGLLSRTEFGHALRRLCPLSESDVDKVFRVFDVNPDGVIEIDEFLAAVERGPVVEMLSPTCCRAMVAPAPEWGAVTVWSITCASSWECCRAMAALAVALKI